MSSPTRAALLVALALLLSACRSSRTPAWLAERARQEAELAARSSVLHDFRFTDQRQASGITFENRIVDDAGKNYKLAHYDNGTGRGPRAADAKGSPILYFLPHFAPTSRCRNLE